MSAKLSLFVLAEVSTDRQQPGRRLPSDYQQEGSKLPSTSSYTPPHVRRNDHTHASWQYKDPFLSVKSSQCNRKWYMLVWDGHRSTANLLCFSGLYTCCCLYRPPAGVLRWHRHVNTRSLLGKSFEHTQNLSVGKLVLRAHLRASPGEIHMKYWRVFCGELRAAKFFPIACRQGSPGKVWQGL